MRIRLLLWLQSHTSAYRRARRLGFVKLMPSFSGVFAFCPFCTWNRHCWLLKATGQWHHLITWIWDASRLFVQIRVKSSRSYPSCLFGTVFDTNFSDLNKILIRASGQRILALCLPDGFVKSCIKTSTVSFHKVGQKNRIASFNWTEIIGWSDNRLSGQVQQ